LIVDRDVAAVEPLRHDVNVQRLRKILTEPGFEAYIQTVRGFGYRYSTPPMQANGGRGVSPTSG
jgi:DNA-binding response OmpR family regulator